MQDPGAACSHQTEPVKVEESIISGEGGCGNGDDIIIFQESNNAANSEALFQNDHSQKNGCLEFVHNDEIDGITNGPTNDFTTEEKVMDGSTMKTASAEDGGQERVLENHNSIDDNMTSVVNGCTTKEFFPEGTTKEFSPDGYNDPIMSSMFDTPIKDRLRPRKQQESCHEKKSSRVQATASGKMANIGKQRKAKNSFASKMTSKKRVKMDIGKPDAAPFDCTNDDVPLSHFRDARTAVLSSDGNVVDSISGENTTNSASGGTTESAFDNTLDVASDGNRSNFTSGGNAANPITDVDAANGQADVDHQVIIASAKEPNKEVLTNFHMNGVGNRPKRMKNKRPCCTDCSPRVCLTDIYQASAQPQKEVNANQPTRWTRRAKKSSTVESSKADPISIALDNGIVLPCPKKDPFVSKSAEKHNSSPLDSVNNITEFVCPMCDRHIHSTELSYVIIRFPTCGQCCGEIDVSDATGNGEKV